MNKDRAAHFLELVIAGDIDTAYSTYVDLAGKHHNMYTLAGFDQLRVGMQNAETKTPHKRFEVKNVFNDGDKVAVHSHLILGADGRGMSVVHMFRFENEKIVEMWDVAQEIPVDLVNSDGPF
jgi:predicted SnoaL-like aldol condensation-catalyzing enzyme